MASRKQAGKRAGSNGQQAGKGASRTQAKDAGTAMQ
jgi:hypothetical protein